MGKAIESTCLYETVTFKSFITALLSISKQKYLILLAKTKLVKSTFYITLFEKQLVRSYLLSDNGDFIKSIANY